MKKEEFIFKELWTLAWNASVQRAHLYNANSKPSGKRTAEFRKEIISFVTEQLLPYYQNKKCVEDQHYKNIATLVEFANQAGCGILGKDGYKYGVAQKFLNLALKYFWCVGFILEPPHCPVDRIIINKTKHRDKINWTQILHESKYRDIIDDIKKISQKEKMSPSEWELHKYSVEI